MSVAAIPIYNALVEQGMPPERAQEAAEAAAEAQRKALEEVARKAEKFTDQKVAESEKTLRGEMAVAAERAAAQTEQVRRESVTRDEFHQRTGELATRAEMRDEFAKTNAQIDALRTELRAELRAINSRFDQLHRLIIALLVIFGGGMATLVGLAARFVFSI